jgi:hypothetical protein
MRVIKRAAHTYDVFCGLGFEHHSLINFIKKPDGIFRLVVLAGERLTTEQQNLLFAATNPKLHYQNVGE